MVKLEELTLREDLVLAEPRDEEGVTPSGLWVDHVWEDVAGHAFGLALKVGTKAKAAGVSPGDEFIFTRAAHEYLTLLVDGKETELIVVNIDDILLVLEEEGQGDETTNFMDAPKSG